MPVIFALEDLRFNGSLTAFLFEGRKRAGIDISMFLVRTPPGDAAKLKETAHSIKGAAANLGAKALAAACFELEKLGRAGTVDGAADRVPEVEQHFHRVCAALEAEAKKAVA